MRKVLLLTLLFLGIVFVSNSQTNNSAITIKGIMKDEADLSARTGAGVKINSNGDNMAIIKINSRDTGFEFDIGVNKPIVEYKTGEIWVYVNPGTRWFSLAHKKYGKSINFNIPIRIESSMVYVLDVEFKDVDGKVVESVDYGFITVRTEPKDAIVYVNDIIIDNQEGEAMMKYGYGVYHIRVESNMYHAFAQTINLNKDTKPIDVKLLPNFGWLNIITTPESAAEIRLNGKTLNQKTPFKTDKLVSGEYSVMVNKDMFKTVEQKVTVKDGDTTEVNIEMPANFALITVNSQVEDADIYIDGNKVGTSNWSGRLAARVYTIEVRKEKHVTAKQDVNIVNGIDQTLELNPKPIVGNLDLMCRPSGSEITINGIKRSETTPTTIVGLLIGDYEVVLSKQGYGTEKRNITIKEGETISIDAVLSTGKEVTIKSSPSGAKLYVDNAYMGVTPYSMPMSFGQHKIKLDNNGKKTLEETITITETGKTDFDFNVNYSKDITFTSYPKAKIYIECIYRGDTPIKLPLEYKDYSMYLEYPNGKIHRDYISVNDNTNDTYEHNLKHKPDYFITYGVSVPFSESFKLASYMDLSFGMVINKVGWYARVKSNFNSNSAKYSYTTTPEGQIDISGDDLTNVSELETGDEVKTSRLGAGAGIVFKLGKPIYLSIGAGYGYYNTMVNASEKSIYGSTSNVWVKLASQSVSGVEADVNLLFKMKRLGINAGLTTINFKYFEASLGIGLWF